MEPHQERKLSSYACVDRFGEEEGKLIITLTAAYSWSKSCFMHTKTFNTFREAIAALDKFK